MPIPNKDLVHAFLSTDPHRNGTFCPFCHTGCGSDHDPTCIYTKLYRANPDIPNPEYGTSIVDNDEDFNAPENMVEFVRWNDWQETILRRFGSKRAR